ncbi:LytR family transcriptional regulator [Anoxybacteroides tepidamans]|uniref:polyisoprenyl-teichoic acid--peptidoglycan teichoic acid transferase TagU n=1 Tax=Anoxybacteroides tepidamans TaxID=265948 RepID=UPI0004803FAF|nr:LytR family transcriptional regulator [Anoxybacillus tepidamans]
MSEHRQRMSRRIWMIGGITVLLLFGAAEGYRYYMYQSIQKTAQQIHEPIERPVVQKQQRPKPAVLKKQTPISFLLMGVDERKGDRGRADSLIVLTVNPNEKSIKMVSIPRDTRTEIVGKGKLDKINHSYAFGGAGMTVATVEKYLDIPIDYYIKVNMESFKDIVDAVGGVTVNNPFAFTYNGTRFEKGAITLNGAKALKYARMRYDDPRGDFGREDRQKQIIEAVIQKGESLSAFVHYDDLLAAVAKNVKTNLTLQQMKEIQSQYKEAHEHVEQLHLKGRGTKINGIFYVVIPEKERLSVSDTLKAHLEMKPKRTGS